MQIEQLLHEDHIDSLPTAGDVGLRAASSAMYVLHQDVTYDYTARVRDVRQGLMIVPRLAHGDQHRIAHHVQVSAGDGSRVDEHVDRFGNSVVEVAAPSVEQSIHFRMRAVLRRGAMSAASSSSAAASRWERPAPTRTRLTAADDAIADAAHDVRCVDVGELTDRISAHVRDAFTYGHGVTGVRTTAAEAWAGKVGVCQDMAHVMIAMCTSVGVAARYVSGHLVGDGASHAWVEVFDHARGTVISVDPTHERRTDLRYVTVAVGRDYHDVAPTSGTYRSNGVVGTLRVEKRIRLADVA